MTTSNHLFAGAIIALSVQQPAFAIPLAFMSHFLMDAMPHYGYEGRDYGKAFKHKLTFVMESVNIVGVPLLFYLLWGQSIWVFVAAVAALSPDFMWVYRYFWFERKGLPAPGGALTKFHHDIQRYERSWGILVEIPVLVSLILVTMSFVTWK